MKKIVSIFILVFMSVAVLHVNIRAKSNPTIYCEEQEKVSQNEYLLKISINNNLGIMGYKLIGKYDHEKLEIQSIVCGERFDNGMFQENNIKNQNQFLILWTGITDIQKNDVLFYLRVKVLDKTYKKHKIQLSYSKEDTFNEKWENVDFSCEDIVIDTNKAVSDNISEETIVFKDEKVNEFVENALCDIQADKIIDIIDKTMKENGIESEKVISDISKTDKKKILESACKKFKKNGVDLNKIKNENLDKQIEAIQKLYVLAKCEQEKIESGRVIKIKEHADAKKQNSYVAIYIIIPAIGIILLTIGLCYQYRKRK